jgi:hypothetical protein
MKKKYNLICLLITVAPVVVLFFLYNRLPSFANTKISGSNGMVVSKNTFVVIIITTSVVWYYLSNFIAEKLMVLNFGMNQLKLRSVVNFLFSSLSVALILSNL